MAAVGANLPADLFDENAAAGVPPARACRELGQRDADDVQAERFARQVRVGAEVDRQILLDVRELPIERDEHVDEPRGIGRRDPVVRIRSRKCSPQIHDIARKPISSMLAQLMPRSGGFACQPVLELADHARADSARHRSATARGRAAASADGDSAPR